MSKIAAVTGSKGFIGSHLARALGEEGWEVHSVDLPENDVRDTEALVKVFKGADAVFHLAALPSVQYSIEHPTETDSVNLGGTLSVLEAARQAGVGKVVFSSTSAIYGNNKTLPAAEVLTPRPGSPYALQKYGGEQYCALYATLYKLPTVSLRYFNVYGSGARAEGAYAPAVSRFLKQRSEGTPLIITGDGEQTRDFVHVTDVVRANILAAKSTKVGAGEVINIGSGINVSINQIAKLIGGPVEYMEARQEPLHSRADITRAKELLGWEPTVSLEEGIAELKKMAGLI